MALQLKRRWPLWAAVALVLVAAFVLVARDGEERVAESAEVRATVNDFATSSDADACDYLTEEALERVYGGKTRCIDKSRGFQGGQIRIEEVNVAERRGTVKATSLDGDTLFTVKLQKARPGCDSPRGWQISDVDSQAK
jgi:hypothetical protein